MDCVKVLKGAWRLLWHYRTLWFFGIVLALVTGGGGASGSNGLQYSFRNEEFLPGRPLHLQDIPPEVVGTLMAIGAGLACLMVVMVIVATVARYVTETALITMVDGLEETGEKRTVAQGLRLGWSRTALRLFLVDLAIGLPATVLVLLLLLAAAAPLLLWTTRVVIAGVAGTIVTIILGLLVVLVAMIAVLALSVLLRFFRRACALEHMGVLASIRRGYDIVRRHPGDVAIMWLITLGLRIGWVVALTPITILLSLLGGSAGGLVALSIRSWASGLFSGATPWVLAAAAGIPVLILVMAPPLALLGGLREVFFSSIWTLTYRELRTLES